MPQTVRGRETAANPPAVIARAIQARPTPTTESSFHITKFVWNFPGASFSSRENTFRIAENIT